MAHTAPLKNKSGVVQASILIGEGVDIITVAKRLGHKDPSTTSNIYAHVLAKADAEANKALADVLFKKKA